MKTLFTLAILLCGCTTKTGRIYPVIGVGWVTVNVATNQPTVVTTKTLGLNTGNGQASLGLSSFATVVVPTNANIIIDLKQ